MFKLLMVRTFLTTAALSLMFTATGHAAQVNPDEVIGSCIECEATATPNTLLGRLEAISLKAEMIQIKDKDGIKILTFDDDTILLGADDFGSIGKNSNVSISYKHEDDQLLAISIEVLKNEQLDNKTEISVNSLAALVDGIAGDSLFTLVDARPSASFVKGHIPGAISIYNGTFDGNINRLPKDKDQLLIYYCDGTA